MLFNSWVFVLFWIVFFFLYWFVFNKSIKLQNAFIAIASFVFYGWWDWRFLLLLWLSLIVDFCVGYFLEIIENKSKRKLLIVLSIAFNIGLLMFFKYFNFFSDSFESLAHSFGWQVDFVTLNLILPVGISFYTFQSLSYTIEVYNKKLKGTKDIFAYAAFISFFPQLVAGPIERAANMLPQYYKKRVFNYTQSVKGMQLILWGLFKKVVVADTCAIFANNAFNNYTQHDGFNLIMGAVFFSFQIYGDFSGYTDIARGLGKILGFELKINFMYPYFSRSIAEFWRRWHISLSSRFRDYVYIPLGGSRSSKAITIRNTAVVFLVSGFWHGANWTFIVWGALHAIYYVPLVIINKHKSFTDTVAFNRSMPSFKELSLMIGTFILALIAWVFFRADSVEHAFAFLKGMTNFKGFHNFGLIRCLPFISIMLLVDWVGRNNECALSDFVAKFPKWFRYVIYLIIAVCVYANFSGEQEFIYFRF